MPKYKHHSKNWGEIEEYIPKKTKIHKEIAIESVSNTICY